MVTWVLIACNILVFLWELGLGPGLETRALGLAFVPARFFGHDPHAGEAAARVVPLLASMYLHAGWLHLLGNMLYLYIFGDNVEDALGHMPFFLFYTASGVVAALAQAFAAPASKVPMVGASGAIAGVLGAYFVLYPGARVVTLIPIFIFFQIIEVPAFFFLMFWFLLQFVSGALASAAHSGLQGGIAWWAHVGGFVTGLAVALAVRIARASSPRSR